MRLRLVHLTLIPLLAGCAATNPTSDHQRPNIIIIMADDMGFGDASVYGGVRYKTPAIDSIAARGLRFTDFHSSGAVCSPTRAGLITGRYQQRAGVPGVITAAKHRHVGLQRDEVTFSRLLKHAGYATGIVGKWHLGYETRYNPLHHGFDRFRGYVSGNVDYFSHIDQTGVYDWWDGTSVIEEPGYTTHLITKHAVQFVRDHKDRPFCLYVAHEAPHYPYQGPQDIADRTVGGRFPVLGSREDKDVAYQEMMQEMDRGVGEIIAAVEAEGLEKRTLIWFFSDNGASRKTGSNGPLRGGKGTLWEGGHRVPGVVMWPGRIKPGTVTDQAATTLDVMPTLLDIAGLQPPKGHRLDGLSLKRLLLEGRAPGPRKLFWAHGFGLAMRDGHWKLTIPRKGAEGLYNLDVDIGERRNLGQREPERVRAMKAAIAAWQADVARGATQQPD